MKWLGLILLLLIYSLTWFGFGMFIQTKADQRQLKGFMDAAFTDGCNKCAQFEIDKFNRDQLQGVQKEHKITIGKEGWCGYDTDTNQWECNYETENDCSAYNTSCLKKSVFGVQ